MSTFGGSSLLIGKAALKRGVVVASTRERTGRPIKRGGMAYGRIVNQ
jgi:hypothetical protein